MKKSKTNDLTQSIIDYLLRLPVCFAFRANSVGVYDSKLGVYRSAPKRGVSDIIAVINGRAVFIEIKTGKDRLRSEQISFMASVDNAKGINILAKDFEGFKNDLNAKNII